MIKTLTKHGNSYALVIDKPILELLRAFQRRGVVVSNVQHMLKRDILGTCSTFPVRVFMIGRVKAFTP